MYKNVVLNEAMRVQSLLKESIQQVATDQEQAWIQSKISSEARIILTAFVAAPRFLARKPLLIQADTIARLHQTVPGWRPDTWTLDRLGRVYLLLHLPGNDQDAYIRQIENLFSTAELQELVALYSALPVLAYPDHWLFRATEAVRSNMGVVFDAVAFGNPYPATYFSQAAWNQMVLKCIFNDKPIHLIHGLKQRANAELAGNLSDLAHERWAAGRQLPPQAWRLVSSFIDPVIFKDIQTLFGSPDVLNRQAAALVCADTMYEPARQLLIQHLDLQEAIKTGQLSWQDLEK